MPVDTLQHGFQNTNDTGGPYGHYTYLGNLGAPRIAHVYFDRKDASQFFFFDPYDYTVLQPQDVTYTNTKSPFVNLTYYKQGSSRDGEERFKAYFAVNANKRLGFGFNIDYVYGRGKYAHQSTALFNGNLFAYYLGDKYNMHFSFINDNLKVAENGGITDDRYVSAPIDMAEGGRTYANSEIPTNLTDIWNHNTGYHAFLTHRYNLGFYRDNPNENDTLVTQVFVPVTSFMHTLKVDIAKRKYISQNEEQNQEYFLNNFLPDVERDKTDYLAVKNTFGISLREGFNKWAKAGLTAFIIHELRQFTMTDTITGTPGQRIPTKYTENVISVGGQLIKEQGKMFHYNVTGEFALIGEDDVVGIGELDARGDCGRSAVRRLLHIAVKIFVREHRASDGRNADHSALEAELFYGLGDESVGYAVGAAGAIMQRRVGEHFRFLEYDCHITPPSLQIPRYPRGTSRCRPCG